MRGTDTVRITQIISISEFWLLLPLAQENPSCIFLQIPPLRSSLSTVDNEASLRNSSTADTEVEAILELIQKLNEILPPWNLCTQNMMAHFGTQPGLIEKEKHYIICIGVCDKMA